MQMTSTPLGSRFPVWLAALLAAGLVGIQIVLFVAVLRVDGFEKALTQLMTGLWDISILLVVVFGVATSLAKLLSWLLKKRTHTNSPPAPQ